MVVIHVKRTEENQFLYETTCGTPNDQLIRLLVEIHNTRLRIERLCSAALDLAQHGPMKPPEERGIDELHESKRESETYNPDPLGNRTGACCSQETAEIIQKTVSDAMAYISKNQVARKVALTLEGLQECIDNLRGATMIAYPMGLPSFDTAQQCLDGIEDLAGTQASLDELDPNTAQLWWAGKEFFRDQTVGDRVGNNEKTKVVVKLQKPGSGPPAREPGISEEERQKMMAFYFKRQEEAKKAEESEEISYHNTSWADSNSLKRSFIGIRDIRFK